MTTRRNASDDVEPTNEPAFETALAHHKAGRYALAESLYREILAIDARHAECLYMLGLIALQNGRNAAAAGYIAEALSLRPDRAACHADLGTAQWNLGDLAGAEASYRTAVRLDPAFAAAHYNLGLLLRSAARLDEAVECYRQVVRLAPDHFQAHNNMGVALKNLGRLDDADACFEAALRASPGYTAALSNRAFVQMYTGRVSQAEAAYREIVRREPRNPEAHLNLAHLLLLTGQLREGWDEYEWRTQVPLGGRSETPHARWTGRETSPRPVLIRAEQGLGDTLQFCRYVPFVARATPRVVIEAQPPLVPLLRGLDGIESVIAKGDPLPEHDYECPLMSLPRIFGTTLDTIPASTPYVRPDPALIERWAQQLGERTRLRIGLAWAGNPKLQMVVAGAPDTRRIHDLSVLGPLASVPGIQWISLQKGPPAAQLGEAPAGLRLTDVMGHVSDLADTAAIVANLDLVISVDTVVAHLAGALGKPVWLLNRLDTCWRWLLDRDDSPWYPTLRQFRQERSGDWAGVIERVRDALVARLSQSRGALW